MPLTAKLCASILPFPNEIRKRAPFPSLWDLWTDASAQQGFLVAAFRTVPGGRGHFRGDTACQALRDLRSSFCVPTEMPPPLPPQSPTQFKPEAEDKDKEKKTGRTRRSARGLTSLAITNTHAPSQQPYHIQRAHTRDKPRSLSQARRSAGEETMLEQSPGRDTQIHAHLHVLFVNIVITTVNPTMTAYRRVTAA
ncbi:hypothetical protein LX32DRAFT_656579 [Colletotrichum zoysiae]|uniref:Uncharacterized protein n=1 Tax=Colletotrichum zoysiae TaxID=1216348 RepID=A0AAD9LZN5_9PEZI|nr:hypothetical protein LX32DRAFT_656579 [Colletotrichum zoysiae]